MYAETIVFLSIALRSRGAEHAGLLERFFQFPGCTAEKTSI